MIEKLCGLLVAVVSLCNVPVLGALQEGVLETNYGEDIEFLARELESRHKDLFGFQSREEWRRKIDGLLKNITKLTEREIQFELQKLVASIGDAHTSLQGKTDWLSYYPLNCKWFDDAITVTVADQKLANALGARLVSVNGVPIETVIDNLRPFFSHDNEYGFRQLIEKQWNCAELMAYACDFESVSPATFVFEKDGREFSIEVEAVPVGEVRNIQWQVASQSPPRYVQKSRLAFWNDWIAETKTVYFKYNRCEDHAGFDQLVAGTKGFIEANDVECFVLDLRDNGGGNSAIFASLFNYLSKNDQLNRPGHLYAIVGRGTFSSGMFAAYDMKKLNCVVVGEPTGGKPNHFGEVKSFELPNTRYQCYYSTKFWQFLKDSDPESLEPDIRVEYNAADFLNGRDPAMDAIDADRQKRAK
ncbi:MAG: hypothetical protein R3C03_00725 [Pirellulaceae bacterium]